MRKVHLNMTMSLDGFVARPHGELDWMTTLHDVELTADIVAQMNALDEAFMGYPTAEGMIATGRMSPTTPMRRRRPETSPMLCLTPTPLRSPEHQNA
jgi:dihydrofolate reductase